MRSDRATISTCQKPARDGRRRRWISRTGSSTRSPTNGRPRNSATPTPRCSARRSKAKVEGKEVELPEERGRPVANLMKALEESLARKGPAKAAGRAIKVPQKRRAGKHAA